MLRSTLVWVYVCFYDHVICDINHVSSVDCGQYNELPRTNS